MLLFEQDEALHGRTQLLNPVSSIVLLSVLLGVDDVLLLLLLLGHVSHMESSARAAVQLLRERLQVLDSFERSSFH